MKRVFILCVVSLLAFSVFAGGNQKGEEKFEKLRLLYEGGEWDKLEWKAFQATLNEKTKREPLPYLYLALAYLELSKEPESLEFFPKAERDAIKYAIKFKKKDRKKEYSNLYPEKFEEFRMLLIRDANKYLIDLRYNKVITIAKKLISLYPENQAYYILKASCEAHSEMVYEAQRTYGVAEEKIFQESNVAGLSPDMVAAITSGVIIYLDFWLKKKSYAAPEKLIPLADKYISNSEEYNARKAKIPSTPAE